MRWLHGWFAHCGCRCYWRILAAEEASSVGRTCTSVVPLPWVVIVSERNFNRFYLLSLGLELKRDYTGLFTVHWNQFAAKTFVTLVLMNSAIKLLTNAMFNIYSTWFVEVNFTQFQYCWYNFELYSAGLSIDYNNILTVIPKGPLDSSSRFFQRIPYPWKE